MYTKNFTRFVALIVVLFACVALAACGSVSSLLEEARGYYRTGVNLEADWGTHYSGYEATYSSGMLSILDQQQFANECFTNTKDVVQGALAGLFEQTDETGKPTGIFDQNAMINALAVNEAYPDVSKCQDAKIQLMNQVQAWRSNNLDAMLKNLQFKAEYIKFLNNDIIKRVLNEAVAKFGRNLGQADINYVGFPSDNLAVTTRSKQACDDVAANHPGDPMYIAVWDASFGGSCTLKRQAAFAYMTRVMISAQTSNRTSCGIDAGLNEQVNADCTVSPKDAPTATPVPR